MAPRKELPPVEYRSPWQRFLEFEAIAAIVLLCAAAAALILSNTGYDDEVNAFFHQEAGIQLFGWSLSMPLHLWINDAIMAIFFFLVGLEIKYELLIGELASLKRAMLPIAGAIGGMVAPALIFVGINMWGEGSGERLAGWGIPMATDIAFAAGLIGLLGKRVPTALSVFLVALAIVDDMGAVIVIAVFYTSELNTMYLLGGLGVVLFTFVLSFLGLRNALAYFLIGGVCWFCFLMSGVHATIAGVLMALTIPMESRYETIHFFDRMRSLIDRFQDSNSDADPVRVNHRQQNIIRSMEREILHVEPPLQKLEYALEPLSVFLIMPIFAFANSGVVIDWANFWDIFLTPVTLGCFLGLLVGKQVGVTAFSWLCVKIGLAELPRGVTWKQLWGVSLLAGIGFTMALFVNELAFTTGGGHSPSHFLTYVGHDGHGHGDEMHGSEDHGDAHGHGDELHGGDDHGDAHGHSEEMHGGEDHGHGSEGHGGAEAAPNPHIDEAKLGIFAASLLSGASGILILFLFGRSSGSGGEEEAHGHH